MLIAGKSTCSTTLPTHTKRLPIPPHLFLNTPHEVMCDISIQGYALRATPALESVACFNYIRCELLVNLLV